MKRVMCYGDSNTWGYTGIPCLEALPPERLDENTRWTSLLQKKLGAEYRVLEEGYNGRTTVYDDPIVCGVNGYAHLEVAYCSCNPCDLVIVMLGTNDVRYAADAKEVGVGMRRLLTHLKEIIAGSFSPECKILAVAPPKALPGLPDPSSEYAYRQEWADEIAKLPEIYEEICAQLGINFANAHEWAAADVSDGLHLGPEGHAILADKLYEITKEIIG